MLVVDDRIAAVGRALDVPEGTQEIDATGGIVMPGMIDTHRHMWQTAMRGVRRRLDADAVLRLVLPRARQDVPARGHPRRQPALGLGAARGRGHHHRRLVPRAADRRPRRGGRRRAAGGARAGSCLPTATSRPAPWEWTADPAVKAFLDPAPGRRRPCSASSSPSTSPATRRSRRRPPSRWPVSSGSPVTTHAGVWGATNDDGIRLMHENGFMTPAEHLRARGHAGHRLLPAHRRHRRLGLGLHRVRAERRPGLPAHLAGPPLRHPGVAVDGHQRVVERRPVLRHADHARRRPLPRAPRGARQGRHRHPLPPAGRAGRRLGHPRRRARARPGRPRQSRARARRPTSC